jgi:hypothetical protein
VKRRCEHALRGLELPRPFTIESLCGVVSERRGRPLRLIPKATNAGPCGLWVAFDDLDCVFYEPGTSELHRDHIITHELGHLLCEHEKGQIEDAGLLQALFPHLSPALVSQVMGRTTYSVREEQEAELFATLVLERSGRPTPFQRGPHAATLDRLSEALGGGPAW